jgi:hypothetical protein
MATAQIQRRRFLSHQRYEKGNLSSAKRLLTFAALLPQTCGILANCGAFIGIDRFRAGEPRINAHMIAASRP